MVSKTAEIMLQDQDLKCQDQDHRILVSSGLKTKTEVSRTTRLDFVMSPP